MRIWLAAALALAGQAAASGVDDWPARDLDEGRIYTAPDSSGVILLISRPYAYGPSLGEWLAPRVAALAGEGVTIEASAVEALGDTALSQKLVARLAGGPALAMTATAYMTPAGHELMVMIGRSDVAEAYVAGHVKSGDIWLGERWEPATPTPPMDIGLECRPEQVPSVVWVLNQACKVGGKCTLAPGSDMILIEQDVCREPR